MKAKFIDFDVKVTNNITNAVSHFSKVSRVQHSNMNNYFRIIFADGTKSKLFRKDIYSYKVLGGTE